jgi:hypothetical protein
MFLCHEGIFYQNGTIKPHLKGLTIDCGGGVTIPTPTAITTSPESPTVAPVSLANTTAPATEFPTTTPTLFVVDTPTFAPTTSRTPTFRPTENTTSNIPTAVPSVLETIEPSIRSSLVESTVPSIVPSDVPTNEPDPSLCSSNNACIILDLVGQCCPTSDGTTLLCCGDGIVEETCALNEKCTEYELTDGTCCPTSHADIPEIDNKFLDCCRVLPDECKIDINSTEEENSKCQFMSTLDYKLILQQSQSASRSDASTTTRTKFTAIVTPITVTMLLIAVMQLY